MDGANKAMKQESYSYKTKYGEKWVEAASMFDVNKTIMRCLVKNLAMFGLGLYIYAGEDLPENEDAPVDKPKSLLIPARPKTEDLGITAERLAIIQLAAENIKEHFAKGNIIDAYGEKIGITDSEESIALNNLLPSNIRSALRNHHESLKEA
jgi:hypothetical protein